MENFLAKIEQIPLNLFVQNRNYQKLGSQRQQLLDASKLALKSTENANGLLPLVQQILQTADSDSKLLAKMEQCRRFLQDVLNGKAEMIV